MDWSRTGSFIDLLLWTLLTGLVWGGGWLLCSHLFRLRRRERLPAGLGLGLLLFILFANLLALVIPLTFAYWIAAVCVAAAGITGAVRSRAAPPSLAGERDLARGAKGLTALGDWGLIRDLRAGGPWLAAFAALFVLFLGVNRGLAIFDDYSNLPLVSIIASGDVPPHFHLNPEITLDYHYGMHLLAASLVRIGGFYPWAALDLFKSLSMALAAVLGILLYRRSFRSTAALAAIALFVLFAGGARWLMLLLPGSTLERLGADVELVGSAMQTASGLVQALSGPWRIEGDGSFPFAFAFISGVSRPLTLAMAGNSALPTAAIFLLLLLSRRRWQPVQGLVYGLMLASLALVSEHLFLLAWSGIALGVILQAWRKRSLPALQSWGWVLLPGAVLAPLLGGVLVEFVTRLVPQAGGTAASSSVTLPGMALRWPPALYSAHLGALELTRPASLLLALIEVGPLLLLALPVTRALRGYLRSGKLIPAGLGAVAGIAFFVPLFLRFVERERDITRLSGTILGFWAALGLPYAVLAFRRGAPLTRLAIGAGFTAAIFGGMALLPAQLIAALQPKPSYFIGASDVWMSRLYWDRLEPGAWVLDPRFPYRPAALFARTTGPAYRNMYIVEPQFQQLLDDLTPHPAAAAGYDYVYLDRQTWSELPPQQKRDYQNGCATLVAERRDELGDFRRLYDIRGCE